MRGLAAAGGAAVPRIADALATSLDAAARPPEVSRGDSSVAAGEPSAATRCEGEVAEGLDAKDTPVVWPALEDGKRSRGERAAFASIWSHLGASRGISGHLGASRGISARDPFRPPRPPIRAQGECDCSWLLHIALQVLRYLAHALGGALRAADAADSGAALAPQQVVSAVGALSRLVASAPPPGDHFDVARSAAAEAIGPALQRFAATSGDVRRRRGSAGGAGRQGRVAAARGDAAVAAARVGAAGTAAGDHRSRDPPCTRDAIRAPPRHPAR